MSLRTLVIAASLLGRLVRDQLSSLVEEARINPSKPYKRRRLKMDPVSVMRRRITKMQSRDPKLKRKRSLYRKMYNRKNKMLLKRRAEFVREAKKRMPPPAGKLSTKRKSPAAN